MEPAVISFQAPEDVRFPAACAECTAPPVNGYRLVGRRLDVRVPLCPACDGKKTRAMALWIVGSIAGTGLLVLLLSITLELVVPFPEEHGPRATLGAVFALVLLAGGALALFLLLRRSTALYHRFFSPVFLLDDTSSVLLAVRSPRFADAARAFIDGVQPGYRQPPQPAFVAPRLPGYLPAALTIVWGIGALVGGVTRYRELAAERGTVLLRSLEIPAYGVAGAPGVLVLYALAAAALVVTGAAWLRAVHRTRSEILGRRG
jgi:hypothetical protein